MNIVYKLLLITSLAFIVSTNALAQQVLALDSIVVDFLNIKNMPKFTHVNAKQKVFMKIKNVNQNLFKVESTVSQTNHNTDLPKILAGVTLPGSLNTVLPDGPVPSVTGTHAIKALSAAYNTADETDEQKIKKALETIKISNVKISGAVDLNNNIVNMAKSCDKPYEGIEDELIDLVKSYLGDTTSIRSTQSNNLKTELSTCIQNAIDAKTALDILVPPYMDSLNNSIKVNNNTIAISAQRTSSQSYRKAKNENDKINTFKDNLKEIVRKASELVVEMKTFKDENKIQVLVDNYNLINYSNFNFVSDTIKVNADEIKFDIKITSDKQLLCDIPSKISITETYKTKGGWKADFSTGAFFNWGSQDFLGRDIQYKPLSDTTKIIQAKDGGSRLLLGVGAFMHIYKRSGNKFNIAFSPGISTTTGFDALNFHLGVSAILGHNNRFVVTVGTTLRESKILDRNYEFDKAYNTDLVPEAPPTIAVFPKLGGFFSLTYNWSKLKKQE